MPSKQQRILWIDAAKALAILMVVFGHVLRGLYHAGQIKGGGTYWLVDNGIYLFHMPLFFALSGYTYSALKYPVVDVIKRLASRIALPYFIWAAIFISIKIVMKDHVTSPVSVRDYFKLLYDPIPPFWFLYALFLIQLAARVIAGRLGDWGFFLLSLAAFALHFIVTGDGMAIQGVLEFMVFFAFGRLMATKNISRGLPPSLGWLALGSMGLVECLCLWGGIDYESIVGRVAGLALVWLAFVAFSSVSISAFGLASVKYLGKNTLAVYCMHAVLITFTRVLLLRMGVRSVSLHLLLATIAATVIPLFVYEAAQKIGIAPWLGFPLERREKEILPQLVSQ